MIFSVPTITIGMIGIFSFLDKEKAPNLKGNKSPGFSDRDLWQVDQVG